MSQIDDLSLSHVISQPVVRYNAFNPKLTSSKNSNLRIINLIISTNWVFPTQTFTMTGCHFCKNNCPISFCGSITKKFHFSYHMTYHIPCGVLCVMLDLRVPKIISYLIERVVLFLYSSFFTIHSIQDTSIFDRVIMVTFSCVLDTFPVRASYFLLT